MCLAYVVTCVHPLQVVVLMCTLLYSPVQSTVVQYLYFKPRMFRSKRKISGDIAGTAKKSQAITMKLAVQHKEELTNEALMESETQRKDKERQEEEEVTEESKRFTTQEIARGFSLFEEALLVFEAQDPNVKLYMKVAAAVQNAIQCYRVIYDKKKEL